MQEQGCEGKTTVVGITPSGGGGRQASASMAERTSNAYTTPTNASSSLDRPGYPSSHIRLCAVDYWK